jgi:hypothetical protein
MLGDEALGGGFGECAVGSFEIHQGKVARNCVRAVL